jgi:hypothetical protein
MASLAEYLSGRELNFLYPDAVDPTNVYDNNVPNDRLSPYWLTSVLCQSKPSICGVGKLVSNKYTYMGGPPTTCYSSQSFVEGCQLCQVIDQSTAIVIRALLRPGTPSLRAIATTASVSTLDIIHIGLTGRPVVVRNFQTWKAKDLDEQPVPVALHDLIDRTCYYYHRLSWDKTYLLCRADL